MRLLRDRADFVTWWSSVGRVKRAISVAVLLLVAAATVFAFAVMGPRLAREGRLLWFGAQADGTLLDAPVVRTGSFKYGEPKYRLTIVYGFSTPDGRRFTGTTRRDDLRDPPTLEAGSPVGVHYDPAVPENSVADYNLRTDVYALALFLPFLFVVGLLFPAWFMVGVVQSHRRPRVTQAD